MPGTPGSARACRCADSRSRASNATATKTCSISTSPRIAPIASRSGIAREIATVYSLAVKQGSGIRDQDQRVKGSGRGQAAGIPAQVGPNTIPIGIEAPDLCRRYVGAIADVRIGPSPEWMQTRLTACGIRPISNVVDVTNYVLLELGQPMHAFDLARLRGPAIVVRRARQGETIDDAGRQGPRARARDAGDRRRRAGGGARRRDGRCGWRCPRRPTIVLESAWFRPQSVRTTSRRSGCGPKRRTGSSAAPISPAARGR